MASEQKQMKVLTKGQQKQTIKGIHKPKKNIIKNYLESPFALEWPELTTEDEEKLTALVRESCSGLRKVECKPPWKQVAKHKGADRKAFINEYNKKFQENLDPDAIKQNNKRKESLSHLIFGFNAVMRALEKDCVAGILVKKNVDPGFVTKSFLPGCAKKCIPLVPLYDFDLLMKDKETLGLPHACMVLGLKPSVKEEANLFNPLYLKMCEALSVEEEEIDEDVSDDDIQSSTVDDQESESSKISYKLSESEIKSYHLKRSGIQGRRAFTPHAQQMQVKDENVSVDFVGFNSLETQHTTLKLHDAESGKIAEDQSKNLKESAVVDFSNMILIDPSGDENQTIECDKLNDKTSVVKKLPNKISSKAKRKAKNVVKDSYVPAKTKRLRGNPNRNTKGQ